MAADLSAQRAPLREHRGDCYDTPACAIEALLRVEQLPRRIWEPACGTGNIVAALRNAGHSVVATDLNDRGCPNSESRVDFLLPDFSPPCDAIVTNPPYALAEKFVTVALERAPLVIMLLRLAFLESTRRGHILDDKLTRVHVFANRLPMMHRANWTGKRASSGMCFAWFVWQRGHSGPAAIDRVYHTGEPELPLTRMMGPDEARREQIKALKLPVDYGPLFNKEGHSDESEYRSQEP